MVICFLNGDIFHLVAFPQGQAVDCQSHVRDKGYKELGDSAEVTQLLYSIRIESRASESDGPNFKL